MSSHGMSNHTPDIIPRNQHHISRKNIDPDAIKILYRIMHQGFDAYLVGGGIRDLLLGEKPKDFDIVTNATPEELKKIFKNCRVIGRRFRLVHIFFHNKIIEVATLRGHHTEEHADHEAKKDQGMILRDNVYGTIEEDVWRRDFTVNALYYNIKDFTLVDFVGALKDIEKRQIHIIGDPVERYTEDPLRMIRAIRFAAKLNCKIEAKTAKPFAEMGSFIHRVAPARLFDEVVKLFHYGHAEKSFELLEKHHLFEVLFPILAQTLDKKYHQLIKQGLKNTDQRVSEDKTLSVVFLFSMLLWPVTEKYFIQMMETEGMTAYLAIQAASKQTIKEQNQVVAISRRFAVDIGEIWLLQYRMVQLNKKSVAKVLHSKRFRAAYDLLTLRAGVDKTWNSYAEWWEAYQRGSEKQREHLIEKLASTRKKKKVKIKVNAKASKADQE